MLTRLALATLLMTPLFGCENLKADQEAQARSTAASDLKCTDVEMTTVYEDPHESWGTYRATGCSQTAQYGCTATGRGSYVCTQDDYTSVSSTLTINGNAFVPDGENMCHSGEAEGKEFYGVDLNAPGGDTLRIIQNADLSVEVVAISLATGTSSSPIKDCAAVQLRDEPDKAVTGDATIDCSAGPWVIKGEVKFQGCE